MVMDTAPPTKLRAIERLGATIVQATYDECWRTVEAHRLRSDARHFVHPFDDDRFISRQRHDGLEILEDLPDVDAVIAPLGGGGLLAGIATRRALRPSAQVFAAEPETAAPLATSLAAGAPAVFEGWSRRSSTAPAASRCCRRCGRCCGRWSTIDRRLARRGARAMSLVAERVHVIAEGAAACASPPRSAAAARQRRVTANVVAVVSGGNIDLSVRRARRAPVGPVPVNAAISISLAPDL